MTRSEFFEIRQKADYLKRHGVTVCAPGPVTTSSYTAKPAHPRGGVSLVTGVIHRMTVHPTDETGMAVPIKAQVFRYLYEARQKNKAQTVG